jgi:hypothetical protein
MDDDWIMSRWKRYVSVRCAAFRMVKARKLLRRSWASISSTGAVSSRRLGSLEGEAAVWASAESRRQETEVDTQKKPLQLEFTFAL